jgi:hypothetical protein
MKIEGSGSSSGFISQGHGYADPDPQQNVMDPEHCPQQYQKHRPRLNPPQKNPALHHASGQ